MAVVEISDVVKVFTRDGRFPVAALDGVSMRVEGGETVAVIGESGSGKSTLARIVLGLIQPDAGNVHVLGVDLEALPPRSLRKLRSRMQIVFQEPFQSLNPKMTVDQIVEEPLIIHRSAMPKDRRKTLVHETLVRCGVPTALHNRHPAALSGGEQQRVGIARAIITEPDLVVLDEPTSSLDLSLRFGILTLLNNLQRERGMTYIFISHDIATVEHISSRVVVLYRGRVMESGPTAEVLSNPLHPYTKLLLSSRLSPDPKIKPDLVPPIASRVQPPGPGCPFYARCPLAVAACVGQSIPLSAHGDGRAAACIVIASGDAAEHRT
jgi:oligopeptide/dipeptide ABC transporter ATP-binding protein